MYKEKDTHDLEYLISTTLRIGVWSSFWICLTGIVMLIVNSGDAKVDTQHLNIVPQKFSFLHLWNGITDLEASQIAMLGIVIMLITPLLRIIFALYAYQKQNNRLYVLITGIVLVIIGISIWIGVEH